MRNLSLSDAGERAEARGDNCGVSSRARRFGRPISLERFLVWQLDDLRDEIVRGEVDRKSRRQAELDLRALGSLVRVMERKGLRRVSELGEPAARAWAAQAGIADLS